MAEVLFPDAERIAISYLNTHPLLDGIHASTRIPKSLPSRFIRVQRIGGGEVSGEELVEDAVMLVEVYGSESEANSHDASLVRAVLSGLKATYVGDDLVYFTRGFNGFTPSPDIELQRPRHQFTFTMRTRGELLS